MVNLLSLEPQEIVSGLEGQKILIYGSNDTGKTKQATKFDKPLLFMTETGGNAVRCNKIAITKCSEFLYYVSQLTEEKTFKDMYEKYHTIIIDTTEMLVQLFETAVCSEYGVRDLSEINGKINGYNIARKNFSQQINKLTSMGYTVIFIAHEAVEEREDANKIKYNYYFPKGSDNVKSSMRMVRDLCDFCVFTKPMGVDPETMNTIPSQAICKETKENFARSRYLMQTIVSPFTAQNLIDAILKAIEKTAEEEESTPVPFSSVETIYTKIQLLEMIKPFMMQLGKLYLSDVNNIVTEFLGVGVKVSEVGEDKINELESIYNRLVGLAETKGIQVSIA